MNTEAVASKLLSLFRGRADHLAFHNGQHFEPKTLKKPLQPSYMARTHLAQDKCLGFYLLTTENKCHASCVDFDNKNDSDPQWQFKTEQLYYYLCQAGLDPLIERSQSGSGSHVWLFFEPAIDAWMVRAFWEKVSGALQQPFKEIYPRQDTLKGNGLGNLVRYPLWNQSAFVDVENEWSVLDPAKALESVTLNDPAELNLLAFQLGFGDLRPPQRPSGPERGCPPRVSRLVANQSTLLGKRWRGDTEGLDDKSNSGITQSICCELVRLYVPTIEIEAALRFWCKLNKYEKGQREDWITSTVTKAYDFVVKRTEAKSAASISFKDAAHAHIDQIAQGKKRYFASGIYELDKSIDGVGLGEVCVVAARPSHGKSAVAFQWIEEAAKNGEPALVISEEMSHEEIGKRRLQTIAQLPQHHWKYEIDGLHQAVDKWYSNHAPVHIVENCHTIDRVEEVVRQFSAIHGVKLVALDYVQLLTARGTSRYEAVTDISRRVKQLARQTGVAVILLSQLNRQCETENREPRPSDLRESGSIEQDADLIIFLQWLRKTGPPPKDVDRDDWNTRYKIICAKRRNGPIRRDRLLLKFDAERQVVY